MSGFISLERNTWDHPVLVRSEMSETEAWAWMLARASWASTSHMVGGQLVEIERGAFMITLRKLQSEFMWNSDKRVRNFLKKLENHGMLAVQTLGQRNARKTHVTICNYDKYQSGGRTKDAPKTHGGRTADAVKKQGNKVTKEDTNVSLPEKSRRKSRIPEDAVITEGMLRAVSRRELSKIEGAAQFQKFKNDALAKGKTFVDWDRAFITWLDSPYFHLCTPQLSALPGGQHGKPSNGSDKLQRIVNAAAAGSSQKDWG